MENIITEASAPMEQSSAPVENVVVASTQSSTGAWHESIQDSSLRGYVETKGFDSVDKLAQSYQQAEKLLGNNINALVLPGEDAAPEAWNEVYSKLGRPAKVEDYKLNLPEGSSPEFVQAITNKMYEAGLSQKQAEALSTQYAEFGAAQMAAMAQQKSVAHENELATLKQEWAQNWDKNLELSRRAARSLGVDSDMANKIQDAVGPKAMLDLFNKIGSGFKEDTFLQGGAQTSAFGMSVEAARAKIQEYKTNATLREAYIAGDMKARSEVETLNRVIAGAA